MKLSSTEFANGDRLDVRFTEDGQDVSPPLAWSDAPSGTKSFALICDDPDAPSRRKPAAKPWVHWIIFNIPAEQSELPQGVGRASEPGEVPGTRQGMNSWPDDNIGYRGPAPPPGSGEHRYYFKLYALDFLLGLPAGASKEQLLEGMAGHVLAEADTMGVYERP